MSPAVIWFCIGIACFAGEIFTPNFVLMFFGLGALAAALVSLFVPSTVTELIVFSIVSVASLLLLRNHVLRSLWGRDRKASEQDTSLSGQPGQSGQTGRTGIVSRAIPVGGEGEIALGGSYWRALADEALPEGTPVRVTGHALDN